MPSSALQYDLVDIPMEGMVRQSGQFFHTVEVVVLLVRVVAVRFGVRVLVGEDPCAAHVQPVARTGLAVAADKALRYCVGGADVVRGIGSVCGGEGQAPRWWDRRKGAAIDADRILR